MAFALLVLVSLLPLGPTVTVDLVEINTVINFDGSVRWKQTIFWKRYEDGFHVMDCRQGHLDVVPHEDQWQVLHSEYPEWKVYAIRYWVTRTYEDPELQDCRNGFQGRREGLFLPKRRLTVEGWRPLRRLYFNHGV